MFRNLTFTRSEVATLVGVDDELLKNWRKAGYLAPLRGRAPTTRQWRRFTAAELVRIAVLAELTAWGPPPSRAHTAAVAVEVELSAPSTDWDAPRFIVLTRAGAELTPAGTPSVNLSPDAMGALVLPLRPIVRALRDKADILGLGQPATPSNPPPADELPDQPEPKGGGIWLSGDESLEEIFARIRAQEKDKSE